MDGSHPQELEKPVSRKACVNLPYVPPIGCGISYTIQVIKCKEANINEEFYLYQLKEPGYCSLAYCAGIYIGSFEVFSKIFLDSRNNKTNAVCVSSVSRMCIAFDKLNKPDLKSRYVKRSRKIKLNFVTEFGKQEFDKGVLILSL